MIGLQPLNVSRQAVSQEVRQYHRPSLMGLGAAPLEAPSNLGRRFLDAYAATIEIDH